MHADNGSGWDQVRLVMDSAQMLDRFIMLMSEIMAGALCSEPMW